ncbi:predicted protein [Naegleria gruberi]|uniref:Predicted protein n=1 Tax=Naegleria gruberi TaxID=5762 RepID=D2V847_NAEGR|nr:uncharacterized protein NAEGRDRAFT_65026 [Naegleria gruberi]EFC46981.1 predicted protein [Naegleria gruberi]|eukprot:XP_002679725.1 predicted protein [Naegleria gruberi strain NEG-M]
MFSNISLPKLASSVPVQLQFNTTNNITSSAGSEEDNIKLRRIVLMSDTHQFYARHIEHLEKALEGSNKEERILLHCGDFGFYGKEQPVLNFNQEFLAKIKHLFSFIIVIIGNHSSPLMEALDFNVEKFKELYLSNATHLLFDSNVKICGLTIHGISWKSKKEDSFQFSKFPASQHQALINKLKMEKYNMIPQDVDIILNHEPPQDIFDDGSGSAAFRKFLFEKANNLKNLKFVAFGHAHSKYGHENIDLGEGKVKFINAALNNTNAPFYFDL